MSRDMGVLVRAVVKDMQEAMLARHSVRQFKEDPIEGGVREKLEAVIAECAEQSGLIERGCEMLGMDVREVAEICIEGMKPYAAEIGLLGTGE